jgi:hypothetical protein
MNARTLAGAAVMALTLALPAFAHHSFAMFDAAKETTLQGTVKEFQWTNPHAWVQLIVPGPDGKTTEWSIECASPNALKRQGWRGTSIKSGDRVTVIIHPLKSGEPGGSLVILTLPDGTQLGRRGPPPKEAA